MVDISILYLAHPRPAWISEAWLSWLTVFVFFLGSLKEMVAYCHFHIFWIYHSQFCLVLYRRDIRSSWTYHWDWEWQLVQFPDTSYLGSQSNEFLQLYLSIASHWVCTVVYVKCCLQFSNRWCEGQCICMILCFKLGAKCIRNTGNKIKTNFSDSATGRKRHSSVFFQFNVWKLQLKIVSL